MKKFLLLDTLEGYNNGFEEGYRLFDTLEDVHKHLTDVANEMIDDTYSFNEWERGLTLYEIDREVTVKISQTVMVEFPEPPQPPTEPASGNVVAFGGERFGFRS